MKLAFLVDAICLRRLGKRVFGGEWRRWYFGPINEVVNRELDDLLRLELVDTVPTAGSVLYVALADARSVPEDVRAVVDEVVERFGYRSLVELLDFISECWKLRELSLGSVIDLRSAEEPCFSY